MAASIASRHPLRASALALACVALLVAAPAGAALAPGPTGQIRIAALTPDVTVRRDAGAWQDAQVGMVLGAGHEIATDPDGGATLAFEDNSTVMVSHTTQLKIDSFFREAGVVRTTVLLRVGEIAAQVHRDQTARSDFQIRSPTATASVRGTKIHAAIYTPTRGFRVVLATGQLNLANAAGTVQLAHGDAARAEQAGAISGPAALTREAQGTNALPRGLTSDEVAAIRGFSQPVVGDPRSTSGQAGEVAGRSKELVTPPSPPEMKRPEFVTGDPAGILAFLNADLLDDPEPFNFCEDGGQGQDSDFKFAVRGVLRTFRDEREGFRALAQAFRDERYPPQLASAVEKFDVVLAGQPIIAAPLPAAIGDAVHEVFHEFFEGERLSGIDPGTIDRLHTKVHESIARDVAGSADCLDRGQVLQTVNQTFAFGSLVSSPTQSSGPNTFFLAGEQRSFATVGQLVAALPGFALQYQYPAGVQSALASFNQVFQANPTSGPFSLEQLTRLHDSVHQVLDAQRAFGFRPEESDFGGPFRETLDQIHTRAHGQLERAGFPTSGATSLSTAR